MNIADKLRRLQESAKECQGRITRLRDCPEQLLDSSCKIASALAEFPDPDAVGAWEKTLQKIREGEHQPDCGMHPDRFAFDVAPGGHECSCPQAWAKAALAKLEVKPDA